MSTVNLIVTVAKERVADALDAMADIADRVTMERGPVDMPKRPHTANPIADTTDVAVDAKPVRNVFHARPGKRVLYTPALTAAKMRAAIAKLDGSTLRAMVLADIAAHPKTSNADVRKRLTKRAEKLGLSVESVDNVIWQSVNRGELAKLSAD